MQLKLHIVNNVNVKLEIYVYSTHMKQNMYEIVKCEHSITFTKNKMSLYI